MFLLTLRLKKVAIGAGVATFSIAVYQANQLRQIYKDSVKLYPPGGPNSGSEKWVMKLNRLKETLKDEKDDVLAVVPQPGHCIPFTVKHRHERIVHLQH